jgi:hypothetical protein
MFKSAAEELSGWAAQCRRWAKGARTREQRLNLLSLEKILDDAALEAELDADVHPRRPSVPTKSL